MVLEPICCPRCHTTDVVKQDIQSGQLISAMSGYANSRPAVADPRYPAGMLASAANDQTIKLWDVKTGEMIAVLAGHTNWVTSMTFCPTGQFLASGSDDETVRIWDVETHQTVRILCGHHLWVWAVDYSPGGTLIASTLDSSPYCKARTSFQLFNCPL